MGDKQSGQLSFKKIWPIKQRKTKNNVANEIFFFYKNNLVNKIKKLSCAISWDKRRKGGQAGPQLKPERKLLKFPMRKLMKRF